MDRKLAAILAADVVGYSELMERDEAGTFERLRRHHADLFEPSIRLHRGRIFKTMGDGLLAEFSSVVDAVECAMAMQQEMRRRNDGLPGNQRIDLRIGVNLGDVIIAGRDRHGEGVNIAARIEQLAQPGGLCVSQTVIDHLSNKLPVAFEDLGLHKVKNIEKPIRVHSARFDGAPPARPVKQAASWRALRWAMATVLAAALAAAAWFIPFKPPASAPSAADARPSVVVLPFDNLSDDKEQGYLADGITEDLTTELARVPDLFVISRNAAFAYKGKATPPAQIAKDLSVRYILEGSTRRVGDDLRINAQLVDAETGGHLWAQRYDGAWAEVFSFQDKVVMEIAGALGLRLRPNGSATLASGETVSRGLSLASNRPVDPGGTGDAAAYDAYLQGLDLLRRHWRDPQKSAKHLAEAIPNFERAVALDPDYGDAHAALAQAYWEAGNRPADLGLSYDEALARYDRHLLAGLKHSSARAFRQAAATSQGFDDAIANLERAMALDPSDPENWGEMAGWLVAVGRTADAQRDLDTAYRLDPRAAENWSAVLGMVKFSTGSFAQAAAAWETYLAAFPNATGYHMPLAAAYAQLGRTADATRHYRQHPRTLLWAKSVFPFQERADGERLAEGLKKAGAPELPYGYDPQSPDRLTTEEMRSLIFGHTVRARELAGEGRNTSITFKADGTALLTRGAIAEAGHPVLDDRGICFWWRKEGLECAVVYRNPQGTRAKGDEFIWINPWTRWAFSVVE